MQNLIEDFKKDSEQVKILLVDDLPANLIALEALLQNEEITIFTAKSGRDALELMLLHSFALALVDVKMPKMSGFELAELMRGASRTKSIPIIFVTANSQKQSFSFKGYESGAVDFLIKPLDSFAVKSKVNVFVNLYRQKRELKNQLEVITSLLSDQQRSKVEAERTSKFKSQFLANMSHEIRTPLGAILGFVDLLKNPEISPVETQKYVAIVERNSQQLLCLIDDILDLSKVEAGKMTIENIQFSLAELLEDMTSSMQLKANDQGIEFEILLESKIPDLICSDPVRLRQILSNILGNAIKFTEKGKVKLTVGFVNSKLRFLVKDTGVGISKEQEQKLFQDFSQADPSTTRKFGGTGLGLVLSKRLAEALQGKLELFESQIGLGSTFLIEFDMDLLPQAKLVDRTELFGLKEPSPSLVAPHKHLLGLKVLLVEDSADNQMLFSNYLHSEGAFVVTASDGAEGVAIAQAGDFDVIVMDIQMPILDGHEATKALRLSNYQQPIIALTAHAMKEERLKCMASGFTHFLTKPLQKSLLIEVLSPYAQALLL